MEPTFPAVHALQLVELLARWNVPPDEALAGLGLSVQSLSEPGANIALPLMERVVARARELSGEPGIGFHLGLQMRIAVHGDLGVAAMTASTIREALEVATRFAPTRTNALSLSLQELGDKAALVVDERASLGSARDVLLVSLLVGIWQIGNALTGKELHGDADFAFDEPAYYFRFSGFSPGHVRFGQPTNQIVFDHAILELPLVMADRATQRVAREQCERALDALGQEAQLVQRVQASIAAGGLEVTLEEMAKRLHLSERTLKRRLSALGTSFSELIDAQRREEALLLMRSVDLSVEEVARRVGYSDAANFTRAFRRWTGLSPRAYRRSTSAG
ncbi:MAG TPA: AraC family transcriptional regulator [Polyangiaceae bacterium]|jgi:AraC-like DNA-binding protein|nr:AraC family transcriptional regulator [Polyangiaceae bacterium]